MKPEPFQIKILRDHAKRTGDYSISLRPLDALAIVAQLDERAAMLEALRALVECPDYRNIGTHEMRNARAILQRIEGTTK